MERTVLTAGTGQNGLKIQNTTMQMSVHVLNVQDLDFLLLMIYYFGERLVGSNE